jgi:predicted amidohydrolase YtcJ
MFQPYEGEGAAKTGACFCRRRRAFEHGLAVRAEPGRHAIGDLANHEVLNAYAQLREYEKGLSTNKATGGSGKRLRHRIEHVQLIHSGDAHRLAELGVIASMQPLHAPSDMLMADRYWGERAALSYAWRPLSRRRLAFGSDSLVGIPTRFGACMAITGAARWRLDLGWYPAQRLTVLKDFRSYDGRPTPLTGRSPWPSCAGFWLTCSSGRGSITCELSSCGKSKLRRP